ncbi:uncharacterized protein HMPREF1541_02432 [Cyphellophora europaea CBS 101466]|uniref:Metallo-beta-lactamase domain-containing protein n=1 Tax=Cyphellophora europaea (strain CBS 101466) TaxID=1220924 RepID=W2S5E5_CYPE1|nr:uncharacterized protein HMPREF1541_02432 [Cyphellophora europaea CBS 101466]ETN43273.1 hypothetical protein HMPREF1541_02432 [Cyphellophora europaea CBS 101466]
MGSAGSDTSPQAKRRKMDLPIPQLSTSDDLVICAACGAQYEVTEDDPRQFVPFTGQVWTTLGKMKAAREEDGAGNKYKNVFEQVKLDENFGIGQSARLIQTPHGNILWDLVAYLDEETIERIQELGGIKMIVISHPHFYTTWADWSSTFKVPVYTTAADSVWLNRQSHPTATLRMLSEPVTELQPGVHSIICGGHFPGSQVMHTAPPNTVIPTLFAADAIFPAPSAHNPTSAKPGQITYMFLWSIPNMIPLKPDEILRIWRVLKVWDFKATYGVMAKWSNVFEKDTDLKPLKERLLDSAKMAVRAMGYAEHEIFQETV